MENDMQKITKNEGIAFLTDQETTLVWGGVRELEVVAKRLKTYPGSSYNDSRTVSEIRPTYLKFNGESRLYINIPTKWYIQGDYLLVDQSGIVLVYQSF